jgi:membrane associated rhomboid family serine protease
LTPRLITYIRNPSDLGILAKEKKTETVESEEQKWLAIPPDLGDWEASGMLSERRVRLWALVLEARKVPCRIESGGMGWQLLVPAAHLAEACTELRLFKEENREWPPPEPPASPLVENTMVTLSVLILLATFYNLTRLDISLLGHNPADWVALGKAHAGKILEGEWWRLVTALTLHADWLHLISNLSLGGIFIVWLCRDLGSGLGWSLLLGSGILGNLANACMRSPDHSSVGASTLVFGAVGILAALSAVRYRRQRKKRSILPIAAALALLALLGTEGKNTDLGAHLFGFIFGIGLGLAAEYLVGRYGRPSRGLNALLALASAMVVITAWGAALLASR